MPLAIHAAVILTDLGEKGKGRENGCAVCHCWLAQRCRFLRQTTLLDKPAVAPG